MTQLASHSPLPKQRRPQVALVGNPNTGKSALFNRLTGARQRVGNYPGLTIEKMIGATRLSDGDVDVIDLPGLYSLAAISPDERVVLDVLAGKVDGTERPDLIVCVLDACNLRRNMFLVSQLAEVDLPAVLVLNMWDAAEVQHLNIDTQALSLRLGVPVVSTAASKGRGIDELKQAIEYGLENKPKMQRVAWPKPVEDAVDRLQKLTGGSLDPALNPAEILRLLFDLESEFSDRLAAASPEMPARIEEARAVMRQSGYDPAHIETVVRYGWLDDLLSGVMRSQTAPQKGFSESIDDLLTHRFFGVLIFTAIMYVVFQSIYTLAGPFMDGIEAVFSLIGDAIGERLADSPMLRSLVVDGLIAGVGGVLVFLPQIVILFFFIALLEDAGYMPRAAFLMDRLFGWCGLSGKSFVPLLSSYACAVPGIMAARTIQEPKARLTTILVCPLMSCSARLPVYVLLIGAFIRPVYGAWWSGFTLFAMHFVGLAVAIPAAFVFNRLLLKGRHTPFVLEMPPYRVPHWRDVTWRVYLRAREFVVRAGTVIFAMAVVIWALCYFPRPVEMHDRIVTDRTAAYATEHNLTADQAAEKLATDEEAQAAIDAAVEGAYLENSYMGRFGHAVQPVFAPAGFDWKITVGVLASFPAREVIISTLGILYSLGDDADESSEGLRAEMQKAHWADGRPVFDPVVAIAIMVFFALCSQCMATLVTIAKESNWKWAAFSFVYMTVLAWVGAVAAYQIGSWITGSA